MIDSQKKIIYCYPNLSTFIKKDIAILESKHKVITFSFSPKKNFFTPLLLIKQFFFLLKNVKGSKVIICKFASYHSVLPALFGKVFSIRSILMNGGTDCVSFPSIQYGNFNKRFQKYFTKWSYRLAGEVVTLHQNLVKYEYNYQDDDFPVQGFTCYVKNLQKPVIEIYNGYDSEKWYRSAEKVSNTFITVAHGIGQERINKLKGIDLVLKAARNFPDYKFYLVGAGEDFIKKYSKENIIALPPLSANELRDLYSKSEFYLQLSISEGFPNSLCEAMLCECIPIGSAVSAIPFIVDETGFILERKDINRLYELITDAVKSEKELLQKKARSRIRENFTIERRAQKILKLVDS